MATQKKMSLETERYVDQVQNEWPKTGRHILAQFDTETIVVYQAFRPEIATFATENGKFGGSYYNFSRMSWIKTNFLWMMYRSGWATKSGQDKILAIRITLEGFDEILKTSWEAQSRKGQKQSDKGDLVRLQWDPDHCPCGNKESRRAIQLGLRGEILRKFNENWIRDIIDITDFVKEQHVLVVQNDIKSLRTPKERVYIPSDQELIHHIRLGDGDDNDDHKTAPNYLASDDIESNESGVATRSRETEIGDKVRMLTLNSNECCEYENKVAYGEGDNSVSKSQVILCLGGAFNPVHTRHVQALVIAKRWLEDNTNYEVVAGRLAAAPDGYVKGKMSKKNQKCMKAEHRIRLCELTCQDYNEWLQPFPKPVGSAFECGMKTKDDLEHNKNCKDLQIAVIIGADRAINRRGHAKWHREFSHITLCIGRQGETGHVICKFEEDKKAGKVKHSNFFVVPDELDNVSSTAIRSVLKELDGAKSADEKSKIVECLAKDGFINSSSAEYILSMEDDLYLS
ncbi:hypothetical protein CHS0354_000379 [Potamilus streckersoni]|uniref:Cytidyltransferase-like domain-containing protein n=1 Tax=Potamilus streckersoni TaxID=2493646 RepID=A0AAE0VZ52_9BIVA|nr:hypothetical protein CHS0354_000379 [Potamilus streckersoni]